MYPKKQYGPFGYDSEPGRMTLSRVNSLGFLTNPLRKRRPIENWSPYELSVFEAAMMLYGKNFHQIHKHVSFAYYLKLVCQGLFLCVTAM